MNCAVLRPLLPEAKGEKKKKKNPPRRNNVDVRLTDGELNLIKQWEIHFQRKEATCGDETTLGIRPGDAHRPGSARDTPSALRSRLNRTVCVQKKKMSCLGVTGMKTLQHVAARAAYWPPAPLSGATFLPAGRQQTGLRGNPPTSTSHLPTLHHPSPPPHYHSSPHSLV